MEDQFLILSLADAAFFGHRYHDDHLEVFHRKRYDDRLEKNYDKQLLKQGSSDGVIAEENSSFSAVPQAASGFSMSHQPEPSLHAPMPHQPIEFSATPRESSDTAVLHQPTKLSKAPQASVDTSLLQKPTQVSASLQSASNALVSHKPAEVSALPHVMVTCSADIVVEDEDFPWPEKKADAAEGWLDNRGEFQYY
jgi:hypothetical protein